MYHILFLFYLLIFIVPKNWADDHIVSNFQGPICWSAGTISVKFYPYIYFDCQERKKKLRLVSFISIFQRMAASLQKDYRPVVGNKKKTFFFWESSKKKTHVTKLNEKRFSLFEFGPILHDLNEIL